MRYFTKVVPDVENTARYLAVHMIRTGPDHWSELIHLIGYLKVKDTKGTIIRNPKVLKVVMF